MLMLAFESSAKPASVALVRDSELIAQYSQYTSLTHSRTLLPMAEDLLKNTDTRIADVDVFAVAHGPGSFTGVRIGVSCANAMALALGIKVIPVSSLAAMRRAVREGVSGIILLNYPSEATMRLVTRSGVPCVVETAGGETHAEGAENAARKSRRGTTGWQTKVVRIVCDAREVAREAATNLAVRQSFASFGYVNAPEGKSWSSERGEFFRETLAERGLRCAVFPPRRRGLGDRPLVVAGRQLGPLRRRL